MRWGVAGQIVGAWVPTLQAAAACAAGAYGLIGAVGVGRATAAAAALCVVLFLLSRREPVTAGNVNADGERLVPPAAEPAYAERRAA